MDNDIANAAKAVTSAATAMGADLASAYEPMRSLVEKVVQKALDESMSGFVAGKGLDGMPASRNGYYARAFKTVFGTINVEVPRDRGPEWESSPASAQEVARPFGTMVARMYRNGLSFEETAVAVKENTGCDVSAQTCRNVVKTVYAATTEFNSRPIPDCP